VPPRCRRCCSGCGCVAAILAEEQRPQGRETAGGRRYCWPLSWAFGLGSCLRGWLGRKAGTFPRCPSSQAWRRLGLKIARAFEFMPMNSALGRIRTCAPAPEAVNSILRTCGAGLAGYTRCHRKRPTSFRVCSGSCRGAGPPRASAALPAAPPKASGRAGLCLKPLTLWPDTKRASRSGLPATAHPAVARQPLHAHAE
jgi:hypothetical protein